MSIVYRVMACVHCNTGADQVECAQCKSIRYCSEQCARIDWDASHQYECIAGGGAVNTNVINYPKQMMLTYMENKRRFNVVALSRLFYQMPAMLKRFLKWIDNADFQKSLVTALNASNITDAMTTVYMQSYVDKHIVTYNVLGNTGWVDKGFELHVPDHSFPMEKKWEYILVRGFVALFKHFMKLTGLKANAYDNMAILFATQLNHIKMVKFLLRDPNVDVTVNNQQPLNIAVKNGDIEMVKLLLSDKRIFSFTSFLLTIQLEDIDVLRVFLKDPRLDVMYNYNCAIKFASEKQNAAIVKLLLNDPRLQLSKAEATMLHRKATAPKLIAVWDDYINKHFAD